MLPLISYAHAACCNRNRPHQGVIDCLLTAPDDGIDAARAAVRHVWGALSTPGVWVSVSHSPPCDRLDLFLNTCHFHDVKVGTG